MNNLNLIVEVVIIKKEQNSGNKKIKNICETRVHDTNDK